MSVSQLRILILSPMVFVALGCTQPSESVATHRSVPATPPNAEASPADPSESSPRTRSQVRALLLARHDADLPTREVLARIDEAAPALRWLSRHDPLVIVRARALLSLRHVPDPASEALLVEVAQDSEAPGKLRAAAVNALASWDLQTRKDLREVVIHRLTSDEVVVAVAAARALRDVPAARDELRRVLDDDTLHPAARAELSSAVSGP